MTLFCVCACVRACVRACVCVCACVRACVPVCVCQIPVAERGDLVRQGELCVCGGGRRKKAGVRNVFLYQNYVIFTKHKTPNPGCSVYSFKHSIKVHTHTHTHTKDTHCLLFVKNKITTGCPMRQKSSFVDVVRLIVFTVHL